MKMSNYILKTTTALFVKNIPGGLKIRKLTHS